MELITVDWVEKNFDYVIPRPNNWLTMTEDEKHKFKEKTKLEAVIRFVAKEQSELSFDEGGKNMAVVLYDQIICPMCYRLNPQHAAMNNGGGCKICQEKAYFCSYEYIR